MGDSPMMPRLILSLVTSTALLSATASAVDIKMVASNAVKEPYHELIPQYEKATGNKVHVDFVGTGDIVQRIGKNGEVADIVVGASFTIDDLIKQGRLAPGRVDLAKSIIGVALRPGAPKPDLSSGESLKRYLLSGKKIIISGGPSGIYLKDLFQKMGIAGQIKMTQLAPGASASEAVAHGQGDIGFTQVSEILAVKGAEFLGPVPADIQQVTTFSAGVHKNAPQPEAAKALLKYLTAPSTVPVLKKTGLEPG
jgi:molybdate transport system substrate-binding protein